MKRYKVVNQIKVYLDQGENYCNGYVVPAGTILELEEVEPLKNGTKAVWLGGKEEIPNGFKEVKEEKGCSCQKESNDLDDYAWTVCDNGSKCECDCHDQPKEEKKCLCNQFCDSLSDCKCEVHHPKVDQPLTPKNLCKNCYGKGYATREMGLGYSVEIIFCSCNRAKDLQKYFTIKKN